MNEEIHKFYAVFMLKREQKLRKNKGERDHLNVDL